MQATLTTEDTMSKVPTYAYVRKAKIGYTVDLFTPYRFRFARPIIDWRPTKVSANRSASRMIAKATRPAPDPVGWEVRGLECGTPVAGECQKSCGVCAGSGSIVPTAGEDPIGCPGCEGSGGPQLHEIPKQD